MQADARAFGIVPYNPHAAAFFDLRQKSLLRANTVVLASLAAAFALARFPVLRPDLTDFLPLALIVLGSWDTARNLLPRWNVRHFAVVLCLYMDMIALSVVLFLIISPQLSPPAFAAPTP